MHPPAQDVWLGLSDTALPVGDVYEWCVQPHCGAVVLFSGTVRDHAEGREDVTQLEYQVYDEQVIPKFREIADEARQRWAELGRIAILHRFGVLELGESAVVVAVAAPHRSDAFVAARFVIDAVKASAPIWKREIWSRGSAWGTGASPLVPVSEIGSS